jgi:hypothetical protein
MTNENGIVRFDKGETILAPNIPRKSGIPQKSLYGYKLVASENGLCWDIGMEEDFREAESVRRVKKRRCSK